MKRLLVLIVTVCSSLYSVAQSNDKSPCCDPSCCVKPSCDKTSCGPAGTKTAEARTITNLREELETVISKMAMSSTAFDRNIAAMKVAKGSTDDESLLLISQAVAAVRNEMVNKVDRSKLVASLMTYEPAVPSTKQQLVASLKKEIESLTSQVEKL